MRDLLFLAKRPLPTPSRSQMIVFAAWGPDPASPDPVTGTVEPVRREFDIKSETAVKVCLAPHHCDILPGNVVFWGPVKSSLKRSLHCYYSNVHNLM